jgi:arsenate reductase
MIFVCYPKCTTYQKAKKWLEANGLAFEERNIKENNPTIEELRDWHDKSGLPLKKFFNTSGLLYKELKLKDRLPNMSEDEQYNLLAVKANLTRPKADGVA